MESLRFLNKQENQNERDNFNVWWKEQIEINGQEVDYYTNSTVLSAANPLYNEDPGAGFALPKKLIVMFVLNNDAYLLSKFGIVADADLNGVIHYEHFVETFGLLTEPKPGDLMKLTEFGADRLNPAKRGPSTYELTEVTDEFRGNPLGSHAVWFFSAKRADYSNEPNAPGLGVGSNPFDNNDLIEQASDENFDYPVDNPCSTTKVYGDY